MCPIVGGDVDVCFPEELLRGGMGFLEDSLDEGRVVGSMVEVLDHSCFSDTRNVIPHGLEMLKEQVEGLVTLALNGFEVPRLRQFVRKGLEIRGKLVVEVGLVVGAVARKVSEPL